MALENKNQTTSRQLIPFWVYVFLFQFVAGLHYTILAPLGEKILPIWVVGLVIGGASFAQLLLDIPAGQMLDRKGYLKMLRVTTLIFILGIIILVFDLTPLTFGLTVLIGSLGWLFFESGSSAYMLAVSPTKLAGKFMGIKDVAISAGVVISVLVLSFSLDLPLPTLAIMLALGLAVGLIMLAFSKPEQTLLEPGIKKISTHHYVIRRHPITHFWQTIKKFNPVTTTLLLQSLASSTFYSVVWFVVPLAIIHEVRSGWTESGLAVFDFAVVILGGLFGYIVDKWKKKTLVLIGLLLFATMSTLIGFSWGIWFFLFGFLATSGEELSALALWAWLNHLDREHAEDGYIAGIISFFSDFGWTIGPILAGFLYAAVGPRLTIVAGGSLLILTLFVYVLMAFSHPHIFNFKIAPAPSKKPRLHKHKH